MEHSNTLVRVALIVFSVVIVSMILLAGRRDLFIRRIQGLTAIDEAIGRATEMGRPMVCLTGLGQNGGIEIVTLQALAIVTYIVKASAKFAARAICPVFDPQMVPVTEEAVRDAYAVAGRPDQFNQNDIVYLTSRQFAFAAGVSGIMWREKAAACFLFGYFYAESLIFAETGQMVGAIQVAGTPTTTQIPFFIAACDYVIIGDEFYAASAYLSREPTLLGSIVGQDICKSLMLLSVAIGVILATLCYFIASPAATVFSQWFTKAP
jgi:hypothetical protein